MQKYDYVLEYKPGKELVLPDMLSRALASQTVDDNMVDWRLCPGGVLPYKGLMGTCGQPGYVFRDFCLEQGIEFIIFCLNQGIDLSIFVLNWVKCLKQGIKNLNSVIKWVGKSAIFVLNRVRVWGAVPHLPNQGYIEYPPREIVLHVHLVSCTLPFKESKLEQIKRATAEDQSMRTLSETIKCGWPEIKVQTRVNIHAYWDVRDELSELNGVVLRSELWFLPPWERKCWRGYTRVTWGLKSPSGEQEIHSTGQEWTPKYRYSIKMHDMLRTPKEKRKGAYDSFSCTKQTMGIGSSHLRMHDFLRSFTGVSDTCTVLASFAALRVRRRVLFFVVFIPVTFVPFFVCLGIPNVVWPIHNKSYQSEE